jgi:YD repeat-containing protein
MQNEKYNFDLNGNRKTAEIQGQKQNYKTGEYNRLLSDENYNYEYDLEGNRISKTDKEGKTTKYFWDHRNRLIKVTTPTTEVKYLYDYLNRLVKRTENKTDQKYFVHDNWQIILQFENSNPAPTHRYLWGTKQDELICDNNNWTLPDQLNTIRDIVKSDGNVVAHLDYNAFGKQISETKNNNLSFAYTGKLFDKASDLQWNINRWYDSNVGR